MSGKKAPRQNGTDPEKISDADQTTGTVNREPTIRDWQILLDRNTEEEPEVQLTIQLLMVNSVSGRAYLEYVTRYRPELRRDVALEFIQLVTTYEALEVLKQLVAEPRCGTDPDYFLWKDVWGNPDIGPSYHYEDLIIISQAMEDEATNDEVRARLRVVREAVERELEGEKYIEHKNGLTRRDP